jgi:hypothetical protein
MKYLYKYIIDMSKDYSVLYNNITGQAYFIKNKCKNSEENPEKKEMNKQFDNFYNNASKKTCEPKAYYKDNELTEIDANTFFENFRFRRGAKGEPGEPGARGFPGPPGECRCKCASKNIHEQKTQILTHPLSQQPIQSSQPVQPIQRQESPQIIQNKQQILQQPQQIIQQIKLVQSYIFGIKVNSVSEKNFRNIDVNNNDIKLNVRRNNEKTILLDCFYLSPNILEINNLYNTRFIDKKIDIFYNNYDRTDYQYFPIDQIASGTLISVKSGLNKIRLSNIRWNIFQNIDNKIYKDNEILSVVPNINELRYKPTTLNIFFEIHSQMNVNSIKKNDNNSLYPYARDGVKEIYCNNTCITRSKMFVINELNGNDDDGIEILFQNDTKFKNVLLCPKIGLSNQNIRDLAGMDVKMQNSYGHVPINQFVLCLNVEA